MRALRRPEPALHSANGDASDRVNTEMGIRPVQLSNKSSADPTRILMNDWG